MILLKLIIVLLPWRLKRLLLRSLFGFTLDKSARIGLSWVFPQQLVMGPNSRIGHFVTIIHLGHVLLGSYSTIGRGCWVTGFPTSGRKHFVHRHARKPELIVGSHSAITKNHHLDCTDSIRIGSFSTIAGYNSQFLTHSIDIEAGRQDCAPIVIGNYCFLGTNIVVLGGSVVPSYSVVGAKCMYSIVSNEEYSLFGGVPARRIKSLSKNSLYFKRTIGFVY